MTFRSHRDQRIKRRSEKEVEEIEQDMLQFAREIQTLGSNELNFVTLSY